MVEQFNRTKHSESQQQVNRSVEITGPILNYTPGMMAEELPQVRSQSSTLTGNEKPWKHNPIFTASEHETSDDDDDDVPEIIKRLSQNGLPVAKQLSDTLSSDMIVNSISTG